MVLVTGATGYVGGRLVPRLPEAGIPGRAWLHFEATASFRNLVRRIADRARTLAAPVLPEALP